MPISQCAQCGRKVGPLAARCPHCGHPLDAEIGDNTSDQPTSSVPDTPGMETESPPAAEAAESEEHVRALLGYASSRLRSLSALLMLTGFVVLCLPTLLHKPEWGTAPYLMDRAEKTALALLYYIAGTGLTVAVLGWATRRFRRPALLVPNCFVLVLGVLLLVTVASAVLTKPGPRDEDAEGAAAAALVVAAFWAYAAVVLGKMASQVPQLADKAARTLSVERLVLDWPRQETRLAEPPQESACPICGEHVQPARYFTRPLHVVWLVMLSLFYILPGVLFHRAKRNCYGCPKCWRYTWRITSS